MFFIKTVTCKGGSLIGVCDGGSIAATTAMHDTEIHDCDCVWGRQSLFFIGLQKEHRVILSLSVSL